MIRNFLYIDAEKLRSISSQVFEGVADSILKRNTEETSETNSQKGPYGSGEILADIFRKSKTESQTKVLEDHAYTILEQEIIRLGKVTEITAHSVGPLSLGLPFVRVTGHLSINDMRVIEDLLVGFNQLGSDMTRVTRNADLQAKALGKAISRKDVEKLALSAGMQIDNEFLLSLSRLIRFSAKGMLEFQISQCEAEFSCSIKREHLRESEDLIIQKYSRYSETEFTIFGIVTQTGNSNISSKQLNNVADAQSLKTALRDLIGHVREIEDTFGGLHEGEIVIDPIAVYHTI